ncbi:heparin-binding EGF-like growth factor b [Ictalurus furcatus]|uniref:heparin-binding EGF-like growth factor b n=1 Tax=Ictalurus furcatus TaxID=66913 RepID=UPI0023505F4B|nr:heparin-binding EGF-like growth factor b [Ictalurus furcatus]
MNSFRLGLVFLHYVVFLQLSGCTSQDQSMNPAVTAGKLLHTLSEVHTPDNDTEMEEHLLDSNEDYISAEYEDDYPKVAFSTKPKVSLSTAMKGQGKGRARKKNPCQRSRYRNYCIHGVCWYLADLNLTSCICEAGYSGERCHLFILPVSKEVEGNSHTTALAIIAAVLSLMCLTVIGILLALRCQKKGDSSVEEKIRLQPLHSSDKKVKDTSQWLSGHDGYHLETSCQH